MPKKTRSWKYTALIWKFKLRSLGFVAWNRVAGRGTGVRGRLEDPVETQHVKQSRGILLALLTVWTPVDAQDMPVPRDASFASRWSRAPFEHDLLDAALRTHVDATGLVDYAAIARDHGFAEYLHRLAHADPADLGGSEAKLAFWINAYNAFAIQGVVATLPDDRSTWARYSVLDIEVEGATERGKVFFTGLRFLVGGRRYTLDEIEKAVLLRHSAQTARNPSLYQAVGPDRADPRIHFALVCAARGCPVLHAGAYEAHRIDMMLEEAVGRFVNDTKRTIFDKNTHTMRVSRLLDWYQADLTGERFTPRAESVILFLAPHVKDAGLARSLLGEPWKTEYLDYDWKLNVQR